MSRCYLVPLVGPNDFGAAALVDIEDYLRIASGRWYGLHERRLNQGPVWGGPKYARMGPDTASLMHRMIMGEPPFVGAVVDHIDGNGLNNLRSNLRWVTQRENHLNPRPLEPPPSVRLTYPAALG